MGRSKKMLLAIFVVLIFASVAWRLLMRSNKVGWVQTHSSALSVEALKAEQNGDKERALSIYETDFAKDKGIESLKKIAEISFELKKNDKAIDAYTQLLASLGKNEKNSETAAQIYRKIGLSYIESDSKNAVINISTAIKLVERLSPKSIKLAPLYAELARAYMQDSSSFYNRSRRLYKNAIDLQRQNNATAAEMVKYKNAYLALLLKIELHAKRKNLANIEEARNLCIEVTGKLEGASPEMVEALESCSGIEKIDGRLNLAIHYLNQATRVDFELNGQKALPGKYINLADLWCQAGVKETAMGLYEKAEKMLGDSQILQDHLTWCRSL